MSPENVVDEVTSRIDEVWEDKGHVIVAIEGRCGAGKSSLAETLHSNLGWPVVHMDDFHLLPEERTEERMREPGGNVAYERFRTSVLEPISNKDFARFRPYRCTSEGLGACVTVGAAPVVIVEGSYSLHPHLRSYYDLKIFLDVEEKEQMRRIEKRESPASAARYRDTWIPCEETYISQCGVREAADMYFVLSDE